MAQITPAPSDLDRTEFVPTAGWESLLSVLVLLGGVAIAVFVAVGIGAWVTSRRTRPAGDPAESDDNPSVP
jgi:ABC-type nitrate/sulfonate/bicarbonate transport system permease component